MEFIEGVSVVARWLFITSLKATIVIALIMIIRFILRDRLPAKWQHALWFLLMIRLVLPFDVPTPFSLFNLTEKCLIGLCRQRVYASIVRRRRC